MFDDLTRCTGRGPNGRQTKPHAFEIHDAEPFIAGWNGKYMGMLEFFDERLFIQRAMKKDERGKIVFSDELLYLFGVVWFSTKRTDNVKGVGERGQDRK